MGAIVAAMVVLISAAPTSAQEGVGLPSPPPEDYSKLGEYFQKFGMDFQKKYTMSSQQEPSS